MLYLLNEFPNIKQTFNLVPLLLEQIQDYAYNNAHDLLSKYTVSDISNLSQEDKIYILDHFFDANYTNQIKPNPRYIQLYKLIYAFLHQKSAYSV